MLMYTFLKKRYKIYSVAYVFDTYTRSSLDCIMLFFMKKIDLHQDVILSFVHSVEGFWDESKVQDIDGTYAGNFTAYLAAELRVVFAANRPYQVTGDFADLAWRKIAYSQVVFEQQQTAIEQLIHMYELWTILSVQDLLLDKRLSFLLHIEWVDHKVTLQDIRDYFARWVRSIGFVRNYDNFLATNNTTREETWLTTLWRSIVAEMNTLGMIIDTAHMSHAAMMEVAEISSKPILNSHANLKHFCPHPRNVEDEFLFALQKNWGVLWLSVYQTFVWWLDVEAYLEQIAYVIDRIGSDHVALGTDFHWLPTKKCLEGVQHITDLSALEIAITKRFWVPLAQKFFRTNAQRILQQNLPTEMPICL